MRSSSFAANDSRVGFREFVAVLAVSQILSAGACAAFPHHVLRIVLVRAEEQMGGIHARWRVAPMAAQHALWNRAVLQLPREAVRQHRPSVKRDHSVAEFRPITRN